MCAFVKGQESVAASAAGTFSDLLNSVPVAAGDKISLVSERGFAF